MPFNPNSTIRRWIIYGTAPSDEDLTALVKFLERVDDLVLHEIFVQLKLLAPPGDNSLWNRLGNIDRQRTGERDQHGHISTNGRISLRLSHIQSRIHAAFPEVIEARRYRAEHPKENPDA